MPINEIKKGPAAGKKSAKKTTKKVAKKSTKSSSSSRATKRKRVVRNVPADKHFVFANGKRVGHYVTLAHMLGELEEDLIHHHVNEFRNDFANWINDVFSEEDLATKVRAVHDPDKIRLVIYKHIIEKHLR